MKFNKTKYILGIFFILVMATTSVYASVNQISFPDDVDDEGPQAPIDGFIVIGIAAGAYLGVKKYKEEKN